MPTLAKGQAPINSRTAQLNAAQQDAQHAAQLSLNQSTGQTVGAGMQMAPKVPLSQELQNVQQTYVDKSNGNNSTYTPATGAITGPQTGAHGIPGATGNPTLSTDPQGRAAAWNATIKVVGKDAKGGDITEPDVVKQAQLQSEWQKQDQAKVDADAQANAASGKAGKDTSGKDTTPPVSDALKSLATTPETQATLNAYQQQQAQIEQIRKENDQNLKDSNAKSDAAYDSADTRMKAMEETAKTNAAAVKDLIDTMKQQNQEALDKQQASEKDNLEWQAYTDKRKLSQQETQVHFSMIAQVALEGGFGQDANLRAVNESDAAFESKIQDVQTQLGVNETTLAAKYSSLYMQNNKDYTDASIKNLEDLEGKLQTIGMAENTNDIGKATAQEDHLKTWFANETALKQKLADDNVAVTDKMNTLVDNAKKAEQDQKNFEANLAMQKQAHQDAVDARTDARIAAQNNHQDSMDNTKTAQQTTQGTALAAKFETIKGKLLTKSDPYDTYVNVQAFKGTFDHAYDTFFGLDPTTGKPKVDANGNVIPATSGERAVADGQMAFQFSHSQNPGSLRIQDVATAMAEGNQSAMDRITATIMHAADGGGILTDDIRRTMKTLIDQHLSDAQGQATMSVLSAWSDTQKANALFPDALTHYTPMDLTTDPTLLNAMYKAPDDNIGSLYDSLNSGSPTSGSPPPSGQTSMTIPSIKNTLASAGFTGNSLKIATAIAMAESAGRPGAMGDVGIQTDTWGPSVGLMQIRSLKNAKKDPYRDGSKLSDPNYNAKAAFAKSNGGKDFSPWSTYTNGAYKRYLSQVS